MAVESMTGYAAGRWVRGDDLLALEAKSVNGKYLSVKFRLPSPLSVFEQLLLNLIREHISRGNVTISCLELAGFAGQEAKPKIDLKLARGYLEAAGELPPEVDRGLTAYEVLRLPGVVGEAQSRLDSERLRTALVSAATDAIEGLAQSRRREGEALRGKIEGMLERLADDLKTLCSLADAVPERIGRMIGERISELTVVELDRERLAQEVAYLAAKADVTEELDRLDGHLAAFSSALESVEPQGRRLDFICQEILRELNTCGSKAAGTEITPLVLEMKVTLDRIREQVSNIA